jgi:hypothetical protein
LDGGRNGFQADRPGYNRKRAPSNNGVAHV